jgi:hypothetical protein
MAKYLHFSILFIFVLLASSSCKSFRYSNLSPDKPLDTKLVNLGKDYNLKDGKYLMDGTTICDAEYKNICEQLGARYGNIEINVVKVKHPRNIIKWLIFTPLALGGAWLTPIPFGHRAAKVKVEMTIKDINGNVLAKFDAKGKHTSYIASWGLGYNAYNAKRTSEAKAFLKAMRKIKSDLDDNAADLNAVMKKY